VYRAKIGQALVNIELTLHFDPAEQYHHVL